MEPSAVNDACRPEASPHNPIGETIRRRHASRSLSQRAFSCGFEEKSSANMRMKFRDAQQNFVVFSTSHVGMPPLALRPDLASVRIYGCFRDAELATHHAIKCSQMDASCNFQVGPMHEWIVASRDAEAHADREETQRHLARIMDRHLAEVRRDQEEYEERRQATQDVWGSWDADGAIGERPALSQQGTGETAEGPAEAPTDDSALGGREAGGDAPETIDEDPPDPSDSPSGDAAPALDTSDLEPHMKTASGMCPPHHNLAVMSFVQDASERNEFAFCVWKIAMSDDECDFYVRNVAGEKVHDHAFYIARTGEWYAPRHISEDTPVFHRQSELNLIMQSHSQRVSDLEELETESGACDEDHGEAELEPPASL